MGTKKDLIYRVRFVDKPQGQPIEATVRSVEPSQLPGFVCLKDFIFKDATKMIILPEEEAASKRWRQTQSLQIPYHHILFVEEIYDEPVDLRNLPFLKEVPSDDDSSASP